jgi:4-hydroxy-3-methylbut-2-enyl diphosphate reductase
VDEVAALDEGDQPVALLAQTTLSHREWQGVRDAAAERWPELWEPGRSDLCFATTNRQSALMQIASTCEAIVVIGSANSSNTKALENLAIDAGCKRVLRINGADELPDDLTGTVGVTAGASAPEELVDAVISALDPANGVEEVTITQEDEYFPPPRKLRDLVDAVDRAVLTTLGGRPDGPLDPVDRRIDASEVLASLA